MSMDTALAKEDGAALNHEEIMALIRSSSFRRKNSDKPAKAGEAFKKREIVKPHLTVVEPAETVEVTPEVIAEDASQSLSEAVAEALEAQPEMDPFAAPMDDAPLAPTWTEDDIEAIKQAAYEEGRAAGLAEGEAKGRDEGYERGKADALETVAEARDVFDAAVRALTSPEKTSVGTLNDALTKAIYRLASQRAGRAIDDMPHSFVTRIEHLTSRVHNGARDVTIRLNPHDYEAVKPHLITSEILVNGNLKADDTLARGDVCVRAGTVRLNDMLSPNEASQ